LLTYDNSSEIRELYEWVYKIYEKEWNYTLNRTDDQKNGTKRKGTRYKGKELFILNYESTPQHCFLFSSIANKAVKNW
jgi:DNA adenine methylase